MMLNLNINVYLYNVRWSAQGPLNSTQFHLSHKSFGCAYVAIKTWNDLNWPFCEFLLFLLSFTKVKPWKNVLCNVLKREKCNKVTRLTRLEQKARIKSACFFKWVRTLLYTKAWYLSGEYSEAHYPPSSNHAPTSPWEFLGLSKRKKKHAALKWSI